MAQADFSEEPSLLSVAVVFGALAVLGAIVVTKDAQDVDIDAPKANADMQATDDDNTKATSPELTPVAAPRASVFTPR